MAMPTTRVTIACPFGRRGGRRARQRSVPPGRASPGMARLAGRVPRVARLLALAIRFEHLLNSGVIASYAELAQLGHVSRARMTQLMNLLLLAPDIQETLLFWPPTERGRDPLQLRQLQPLTRVADWGSSAHSGTHCSATSHPDRPPNASERALPGNGAR